MTDESHLDACPVKISFRSDEKYGRNRILNISFGEKSDSGKKDFSHLEFYLRQRKKLFAFSKTSVSEQLALLQTDVLRFLIFSFFMQK